MASSGTPSAWPSMPRIRFSGTRQSAQAPGARGDRDADAVARLRDRQEIAVGGEGGGDVPGPFGINHVLTSTAMPDHSPKTPDHHRDRRVAGARHHDRDVPRRREDAGEGVVAAGVGVGEAGDAAQPVSSRPGAGRRRCGRSSPSARPGRRPWYSRHRRASARARGRTPRPAEVSRKISEPVREIVSATSASTCSGSGVCRLSTNSHVRSSVAETALVSEGSPPSTANGGQGDSSSFSARQIDQRPGRPWVACSSTCGRMPKALRTIRPMARATVAFGRKPGPNAAAGRVEPQLMPDRAVDHDHRGGPAGGLPAAAAGGALAHQRVERGQHHREVLRQAAGHGRVDGGQVDRAVPADLLELADDLVRAPAGGRQELLDQRLRRGDQRQAVGPALGVAVFDGGLGLFGVRGWCHSGSVRRFITSSRTWAARCLTWSGPSTATGWGVVA